LEIADHNCIVSTSLIRIMKTVATYLSNCFVTRKGDKHRAGRGGGCEQPPTMTVATIFKPGMKDVCFILRTLSKKGM